MSAFAAGFSRISRGWDDPLHDPAVRTVPAVPGEFLLEILLAPNASLIVGGRLDIAPIRGVDNPVTGDDVLAGRTTRLGKIDNDATLFWMAGLSVRF